MSSGHLFIDDNGRILSEYLGARKPGQPEPGNEFVKWLLQNQWVEARVTRVPITPSEGTPTTFQELPAAPEGVRYDPADQKFLAVAAAHAEHPPILQAFDSKWWGWQDALKECSVSIHFLCPEEIAAKYAEKIGG